jgi:hypothetical protein
MRAAINRLPRSENMKRNLVVILCVSARFFTCLMMASWMVAAEPLAAQDLKVGYFEVDASPDIGSPLAYDPCVEVSDQLSCRGVVIVGAGEPIVLVTVDWLGIANDGHEEFRQRLAAAIGSKGDRVSLHALHQHDAPRCDLGAMRLLEQAGCTKQHYDRMLWQRVLENALTEVKRAIGEAKSFDQIGYGEGEVQDVASNRRLLDANGKVVVTRYTATKDPVVRAMPTGTIDPKLRLISFWKGDEPIVALTYYATHPQSYYRTGKANPDFPGLARNSFAKKMGLPVVHFNGAAGNIGAGKWNDGSVENRAVLAGKIEAGMEKAWKATQRSRVAARDVEWKSIPVRLQPAGHLQRAALEAAVADANADPVMRLNSAEHLSYLNRFERGGAIDVGRLKLADAQIVHMPGELFVEDQLAAAAMVPGGKVALAAYGDYGTAYIGTAIGYQQGGYETSNRATCVGAEAESILVGAMKELLGAQERQVGPLGVPPDPPAVGPALENPK